MSGVALSAVDINTLEISVLFIAGSLLVVSIRLWHMIRLLKRIAEALERRP